MLLETAGSFLAVVAFCFIVDSMLRADNLTSHYVTETLVAAGMIAMSIIVMDGLFRLFFKKKGESYVDRQQLD